MAGIGFEQLVDLVEGRLDASASAALRAHVAADPAALASLTKIEHLIGLMRTDTSVDAPEHVIQRAVRLIRRPAPLATPGPLRRLVVALTQSNWRSPQRSLGLRSVQPWPRAILLSAGDRELDLQVGPLGQGWQLMGQVLGPEQPGSVSLSSAAGRVAATLSELGEFVLPPVTSGQYTLTITQGALEIVVPNLELGTSSNQS